MPYLYVNSSKQIWIVVFHTGFQIGILNGITMKNGICQKPHYFEVSQCGKIA